MSSLEPLWNRLGLIVKLVKKEPRLGRTALMKYLYFLKELHHVPLEYCFQLYAYGPFDSDVLYDLDYAESLKAVQSELQIYPMGGYGYKISKGPKADEITQKASKFLETYNAKIDQVISDFQGSTASELELIATIIYVDRELHQQTETVTIQDIIDKTHKIKPRYKENEIEAKTQEAMKKNLLSISKDKSSLH